MFSIDLAAERIIDRRSREYFGEVSRSFANGCYRSSLVMLWTVVICDLIYKLQMLRDMHHDAVADRLLCEIETKQKTNPTNPDWEIYLLNEVYKRTQLLEPGEYAQLQSLQQLRHLSAHPVLTGTDLLFHPTKEAARAHMRTALEAVLLRPPLFSKKIVSALVSDIAANKTSLISKDILKTYLSARYFQNMPLAVEIELFRALWKFCFKLRNTATDTNRDINIRALSVIYDRNPGAIREAIDGDQTYFSDVGPDDCLIISLITFLLEYPSLYRSLNSAAQVLIKAKISSDINIELNSAFVESDFSSHIAKLFLITADDFDLVATGNWITFIETATTEGLLMEACDIAIQNYGNSGSYDDADLRFERFVAPILDKIDGTRMEKLLGAIEGNCQTYDRRRAKYDHKKVADAANAIPVDTSVYPNFTANI